MTHTSLPKQSSLNSLFYCYLSQSGCKSSPPEYCHNNFCLPIFLEQEEGATFFPTGSTPWNYISPTCHTCIRLHIHFTVSMSKWKFWVCRWELNQCLQIPVPFANNTAPWCSVYQICRFQSSIEQCNINVIIIVLSHYVSPILLYRHYYPDQMITRTRGPILGSLSSWWPKCQS